MPIRVWCESSNLSLKNHLSHSLCQRLGFVLFTDKAASAKCESSAEGARNERFSASKVCRRQTDVFTLVPSDTVAPNSFHWYNTNTWSVAQTTFSESKIKMYNVSWDPVSASISIQ